ncbi:hypothetical protein M5W68_14170 [Paenibacillus larvae]|uniref:hypothetical protein n=1 Tax=Paenibacillus larvae TaxID=1464 RepID=UPI00227E4568|nr:hypothetical protein [Paenibacillus larvae]MCY9511176.1 hypothetical protein [Paenibacillus larvae]MCY9526225.1 hypothetical protein [Paenibacillus larvae]
MYLSIFSPLNAHQFFDEIDSNECLSVFLIVMLFSPLASSFAAEDRELNPNDPRVQQLAEEMEFVFTQAITQKDKDQRKYELNENKLVNKGFKQEEINGIKQLAAYL